MIFGFKVQNYEEMEGTEMSCQLELTDIISNSSLSEMLIDN